MQTFIDRHAMHPIIRTDGFGVKRGMTDNRCHCAWNQCQRTGTYDENVRRTARRRGIGTLGFRAWNGEIQIPRNSSFIPVFARVLASTCFTITAQ